MIDTRYDTAKGKQKMTSITEFLLQAENIIEQYADNDLTYAQGEIMIDQVTQNLLMQHLENTPDDVLEASFHAYATFQLEAFRQGDVTENEAVAIIEQRAQDYFDKSRSPKDVEKLWAPYDKKVEDIKNGEENDPSPISGHEDDTPEGFWGPFSLN